jgi:hypothetical protein
MVFKIRCDWRLKIPDFLEWGYRWGYKEGLHFSKSGVTHSGFWRGVIEGRERAVLKE